MRFAIKITLVLALSQAALAGDNDSITEITIQAFPSVEEINSALIQGSESSLDAATLLQAVPGANSNSNGAITGIAQYRGMYGDRLSVSMDSAPILTGGPSAMDTPLSYAPAALLKELSVHRGMAPVRLAQESIGGHISTQLNRGAFASNPELELTGFVSGGYLDNGAQGSTNIQLLGANNQHKISLLASHNEGNNQQAGQDLEISGSQYQRDRFDLSYAWQTESSVAELFAGRLHTKNSGTPALAMDIAAIETDLLGFNLKTNIDGIRLTANMARSDVFHIMDNHSLRQPPMMSMNYRTNMAEADSLSWRIQARMPISLGIFSLGTSSLATLTVGTDGNRSSHQSLISNPQNPMFELVNFKQTQRNILGIYGELAGELSNHWHYEAGLRLNKVSLDTSDISASGMMGTMGEHADMLANQFNSADRHIAHNNTDAVIKLSKALNQATSLNISLGIKNRAPSYQEAYLWLPMPITAGLADGRSYLGNITLESETATEINIGVIHNRDNFSISPQLFIRNINNYIQGVPTTNMAANMLSNMMSGTPALMYDNVDARIYGVDANWHYMINANWSIDGILSYVRGKRTDMTDNLYRISPANSRLTLRHRPTGFDNSLELGLETQLYAKQNKVSSYNNESPSAGYGVVNLFGIWSAAESTQIRGGLSNIFDRAYSSHVAGCNRIAGSDITLGDKLPGLGRTAYIALQINW
ncbi:MAG: TonB-dependent receptor [Porticoccaceae bacterium]|nr:TonB-dependent receptor [Porticoccaceae bacterium]